MTKITLTTTLALLREKGACVDGYKKLKKSLGSKWADDTPINLTHVLDSNGVSDMLWCLRATQQKNDRVARLMAADFAESVLRHFTKVRPNDTRPAEAIQAARDFANGKINAYAADAAASAASAAAYASYAAYAADAAASAASYAAYTAYAADDEKSKQAAIIRSYLK